MPDTLPKHAQQVEAVEISMLAALTTRMGEGSVAKRAWSARRRMRRQD
jgi:hypothetical protein